MIATWKMAFEGVGIARPVLAGGGAVREAIEAAICAVEDDPRFVSVGYGGLPNQHGEVELDAAYMDGETLSFGGVMGVRNVKNPIKVAMKLSEQRRNCLLCGAGAELYSQHHDFQFANMLSAQSHKSWVEQSAADYDPEKVQAYTDHDTVCVIGMDTDSHMAAGVSTSGLFMKHPGRVGDSPVIGSGFYCDGEIGGACATGVGEEIMKGCLSFDIVRGIGDGLSPQQACEKSLTEHIQRLERGGMQLNANASVIAMDKHGNIGAASNLKSFAFIFANENTPATIYLVRTEDGAMRVAPATPQQLAEYTLD